MDRLTRKNDFADFTSLKYVLNKPVYIDYDRTEVETIENVFNKLGKLEDIEEELGVDLITLFNALKNGIYVSNDEGKIFHQNVLLHYDKDFFNKMSFQLYSTDGFNYYLKDYGKTWALTR